MPTAFLTGTFDPPHVGSIAFLQACRLLLPAGTRIVIGLTSDALAARQKRIPSFSYAHRRAMLLALPEVDVVLAHNGQTKEDMLKQLHFDFLMTGEEYRHSTEYTSMEDKVKVFYLPCPLDRQHASTEIAMQQMLTTAENLVILKNGTSGLVYQMQGGGAQPLSIVIKTVRVSQRERQGTHTANVYGMPIPNPRNWAHLPASMDAKLAPVNLPGVNAYRELRIHEYIKGYAWNCIHKVVCAFSNPAPTSAHPTAPDWSHVQRDKQDARDIYFIHQRFAGPTLAQLIHAWQSKDVPASVVQERVRAICLALRDVVLELRTLGIVHGDLHAENVCVKRVRVGPQPVIPTDETDETDEVKTQAWHVSLIDWGWCLHHAFVMQPDERHDYHDCLTSDWDWTHFKGSMKERYPDLQITAAGGA